MNPHGSELINASSAHPITCSYALHTNKWTPSRIFQQDGTDIVLHKCEKAIFFSSFVEQIPSIHLPKEAQNLYA